MDDVAANCEAKVIEDRARVWDTGAELQFSIPDWDEGVIVRVGVGTGIHGVQTCWNIAGTPELDQHHGILSFALGARGHDDQPIVGCLLQPPCGARAGGRWAGWASCELCPVTPVASCTVPYARMGML